MRRNSVTHDPSRVASSLSALVIAVKNALIATGSVVPHCRLRRNCNRRAKDSERRRATVIPRRLSGGRVRKGLL